MIKRTLHTLFEKLKSSGRRTQVLILMLLAAAVVGAGYGSSLAYGATSTLESGFSGVNATVKRSDDCKKLSKTI